MSGSANLLPTVSAWYASLASRDQRVVRRGGACVAVLLVAGSVWQLHSVCNRLADHLARIEGDITYIQGNLAELRSAPQPQSSDQSLVTMVDHSTRDGGLAGSVRGTEPAGAGGVRVRLEGASYELVVAWLLKVEREYGLKIQAATLERTEVSGHVNASVTLAAG
jgi:type II secretory pathway component PulM